MYNLTAMFTGLIRNLGELSARRGNTFAVKCPSMSDRLAAGDSVAVNGVCLTVTKLTPLGFSADLLEATRTGTTLGKLPIGSRLNLEPAMRASDSLGGHFIQGHVDGTVQLQEQRHLPSGDWQLSFELPAWLKPWVIARGSIAVDGVSLTVQELGANSFTVMLIPTTWEETTLQDVTPGSPVNIEADMLVKAVRSSLEQMFSGELTEEKLRNWGYGQ
jgi:riboflavin synthase